MSDDRSNEYRPVNAAIGSQANFGPIPAEHLIPWMIISTIIFALCRSLLGVDWQWTILLICWGDGTWWMLAGRRPWRFLSKFVPTPNWTRGGVKYQSLLAYIADSKERSQQSNQMRRKYQSLKAKGQRSNTQQPKL